MSRMPLLIVVAATAAALACAPAGAQMSSSDTVKPRQTIQTSQPSTAKKVENWTRREWNAAKVKWSKDKAAWGACNRQAKSQKLSGRKSWTYLYDCMKKA